MKSHFDLSDSEFESQFADTSINPSLYCHEAHLRLAWIHITKYGVEKAIKGICTQIQTFAKAHGEGDKYNMTVTTAAIRTVYHFMLKSKSENFHVFILEFPRLKNKFKQLLDSHYSIDIFNSDKAKRGFLQPDKLPFDNLTSGYEK
jgi:hypothetical protein